MMSMKNLGNPDTLVAPKDVLELATVICRKEATPEEVLVVPEKSLKRVSPHKQMDLVGSQGVEAMTMKPTLVEKAVLGKQKLMLVPLEWECKVLAQKATFGLETKD